MSAVLFDYAEFGARIRSAASVEEVMEMAEEVEGRAIPGVPSAKLWRAVAEETPWLDDLLIRALDDLGVTSGLLNNPQLREEWAELLLEEYLGDLDGWNLEPLQELARRGRIPVSGRAYLRLRERVESGAPDAAEAFRILCHVPEIPEADLDRALRANEKEPTFGVRVALEEEAPARIYRRLLQGPWSDALFLQVAQSAVALQDKECRPLLWSFGRWRSAEVLACLARQATAEEFLRLFADALRHGPREAARVLETAPPEVAGQLERHELLPLLESEEARVRLVAIRASGGATNEERADLPKAGRGR